MSRWGLVAILMLAASACSSGSKTDAAPWEGPFGKRPAEQVYVLRPTGPVRSVVVFGHGWSDYTPRKYLPWFRHLLAGGSAIVYPRYQATDSLAEWRSGEHVRQGWFSGIRTGFAHLGVTGVPVVAAGYSAGGALVYLYATRAEELGLPVPSAVDSIFPGGTVEFIPGAGFRALPFPARTRILVQVRDRDTVAGRDGGDVIWRSLRGVPAARKRYEIVRSSGGFIAEHLAPQGSSKRARQAFWAPLDASIAAARAPAGVESPAALLPTKLGSESLRRESYTGPVFARAKFTLSTPVSVDVRRFLALLGKRPSELAVAWAISNYEGHIKVFAFRVAGAGPRALVRAYLKAITVESVVGERRIAGKRVTTTSAGLPIYGYLYAKDDVLFMAVDIGLRPGELRKLFAALP